MGQGAFFGELAFFSSQIRTSTVKAVSFCDLEQLFFTDLDELLDAHTELRAAVIELAEKRVKGLQGRLKVAALGAGQQQQQQQQQQQHKGGVPGGVGTGKGGKARKGQQAGLSVLFGIVQQPDTTQANAKSSRWSHSKTHSASAAQHKRTDGGGAAPLPLTAQVYSGFHASVAAERAEVLQKAAVTGGLASPIMKDRHVDIGALYDMQRNDLQRQARRGPPEGAGAAGDASLSPAGDEDRPPKARGRPRIEFNL
jgi:hypothetical protein